MYEISTGDSMIDACELDSDKINLLIVVSFLKKRHLQAEASTMSENE